MNTKKSYSFTVFSILFSLLLLASSFINSAKAGAHFTTAISITDTVPPHDTSESKIFEKVEIESSFPGGESSWRQFLVDNLNANTPVDHGAPAGSYTVWVQFIIDKEGKPSEFKALTHFGYGMEAEVLRVLRKAPSWTPAMQGGRLVKAYRKQPITFVVEEEKRKRKRDRG